MSVISQFFPSGDSGGGGGGSSNIGGGTVPVEILGISGGGGGGAGHWRSPYPSPGPHCNLAGGMGGMGAFFYANNYYLTPGITYPICVGSGGSGGIGCLPTGTTTRGSNGGFTSFNNPVCQLQVEGGGGGGAGTAPSNAPGLYCGVSGGTGGGGAATAGGSGLYFNQVTETRSLSNNTFRCVTIPGPGVPGVCTDLQYTINSTKGEPQLTPWGIRGGFPGSAGYTTPCVSNPFNSINTAGCGGGMMSNQTYYCNYCINPSPAYIYSSTAGSYCSTTGYQSDITGSIVGYGNTIGSMGSGGSVNNVGCYCPGSAGGAGALIIKWPSGVLGAAPPTGFPGGTNISPQTPGYNAYCFTSSGSITLP